MSDGKKIKLNEALLWNRVTKQKLMRLIFQANLRKVSFGWKYYHNDIKLDLML